MGPSSHKSRALIGQAGKLNLELAFLGPGAEAENFKYKPGAIYHLCAQSAFQIALLHRCQGGIDHAKGAVGGRYVFLQAFKDTAGQEMRCTRFAHILSAQESKVAAQRFNEAGCLGQPLTVWPVARLRPWNDNTRPILGRCAVNEFGAQSLSAVVSSSKSWTGAPGAIVEIACL